MALFIQILLNIAHKRPELFTPANCFNDNSIKAFVQEPRQLAQLIEELKNGPLPQLTDDLLNTFGKSVAAPPVTLQSTYFALLPEEARDKDFNKVFQYFVDYFHVLLTYFIYINAACCIGLTFFRITEFAP